MLLPPNNYAFTMQYHSFTKGSLQGRVGLPGEGYGVK